MKKLMFAAIAALAMVGTANAEKSYGIIASNNVSAYELDTAPGNAHKGWYSSYVMKQEDAQAAMGCVGTSVTYSDMAKWLGENFADNKASVIANAEAIGCTDYANPNYDFFKSGGYDKSKSLGSAIGVFFYDDGENLAYNVTANHAKWGSNTFAFDDSECAGSGWQAASVPEPTSGLLLLLGVAGLALKRKRA